MMEHWKQLRKKIYLHDDSLSFGSARVLSLKKEGGGIKFEEDCDEYYSVWKSKEDSIKALEEAIAWIKGERILKEINKDRDEYGCGQNTDIPLSKAGELFRGKAIEYSKQVELVKDLSVCDNCGEEKHSAYAWYEIESAKLKKITRELNSARKIYETEVLK